MKSVSLRHQINLRIILVSLVIWVLGGAFAIMQAKQSVKKELDSSLNLAFQLIQSDYFTASSDRNLNMDAWLPRIISLDQTRHLSIQLKQADGITLNFAGKGKPAHDIAPPLWFVALISAESPKIEKQLTNADGSPVSLIIQANPIDEISEAWQESCAFFTTFLIMTTIMSLTVNLLFKKTFKAIDVIVYALKRIEEGDYQQKLPDFSTLEHDNIAKAVNHMTDVLAKTSKENKALTLHTLQIQEEERQHLAKELHDELGQSLTAIKVMATAAKNAKTDTAQIADTIMSVCDHLITVVRSMMRNLHPMALTELGLKASLEDLLNYWSQRHPELDLKLTCPDNVDKLKQNITIQLFRIVQECLNNMIRHAQATEGSIKLEMPMTHLLQLEIADNGQGCTLSDTQKGFGLLGIRERIFSLGGELAINTGRNKGMKIIAIIPIT